MIYYGRGSEREVSATRLCAPVFRKHWTSWGSGGAFLP